MAPAPLPPKTACPRPEPTAAGRRDGGLVAAVLGALMILTGLFSGLSETPTQRFTWFLVSTGAFLAIYATLFGPLRQESKLRDAERRSAYGRNVGILALLWGIYPIVVALGPDGAGVITSVAATGWITILDLTAKVGYALSPPSAAARSPRVT